jgi:hypothetical protein
VTTRAEARRQLDRHQRELNRLDVLFEGAQAEHAATLELVSDHYSESQRDALDQVLEVLEQSWPGQRKGQFLALRVLVFRVRSLELADLAGASS